MNARTALATRSSWFDETDRLAVVGESPELPGWVHDWCRRNGPQLRGYRIPTTAPGHQLAPARLIGAIAPLTRGPVLIAPPARPTPPHAR